MFWRRREDREDPETAGRRALLSYLADLERQNLIQWSSNDWGSTTRGGHVVLRGKAHVESGELIITLKCNRLKDVYLDGIDVSLKGNGMMNLDSSSIPGLYKGGSSISYLLERAIGVMKKTDEATALREKQEKNQHEERAAQQILSHLGASSAS